MTSDTKMRIEQPKTLTEIVVQKLRAAIIEGHYGFGENISEDKLAAAFGVSRTPVRDALSALQFTGLVTVKPKRGSFVFVPTIEDVGEICDYRLMLEREALRLSMQVKPDAFLAELDKTIEQMRERMQAGDEIGYVRLDTVFHNLFFDHCGNRLVQNAFHLVEARIATIRTALNARFKQRREASFDQHVEIVEGLRARDWDRVDTVLRRHITSIRADAIDELSKTA
ncbi:GntR family transcriptional regulator [Primorskyibacter sp. 2E107]|uniref:GntR family transcriptional regulator n=1 Tax=Primorskyibacter sp. 2E107 TaxID=3403458 RepID=UPI003AF599BA